MVSWNPWHGCHKYSEGCMHCYVYRSDAKYDRDASVVSCNKTLDLPIRKNRKGEYKYPSGTRFDTCFTSDFFVEDADVWRNEAWRMMKERKDCTFLLLTKRILRFEECKPEDWGSDYAHVHIYCTVENDVRAKERLPVYLKSEIYHKQIVCSPLLSDIDLMPYLNHEIEGVCVGGESGEITRVCDYDWVLSIREQCLKKRIPFQFQQTGARFRKDGRLYRIRRKDQRRQARKAGLDLYFKERIP